MTEQEEILLQALIELETAATTMRSANRKPDLLSLFNRVDTLTRQLPKGTAPDLLHYLHNKSYQKARLFLQGRDAENTAGSCPRPGSKS